MNRSFSMTSLLTAEKTRKPSFLGASLLWSARNACIGDMAPGANLGGAGG